MYVRVLLLSFLPLLAAQQCPWGVWYLSGIQPNGYDYCGACWLANYSRSCLKIGSCTPCPPENSTQFAEANLEQCQPPRAPCCPGYAPQPDGTCGPLESPLPPEVPAPNPLPICQVPGFWQEWGSWSACNATCGMCGVTQRNRSCVTGCSGCNPKEGCQIKACGGPVCTTGDKCCNNASVTIGYDGAEYCNPFAEKILEAGGNLTCEGCWTEWADARNAVCNATCGLCGSVKQERFCMPSGCTCEAAERERIIPCTSTPCTTGPECCAPYEVKVLANGTEICDVPCISTWSQWYQENITGYDTCGGCFDENYYRVCHSNDTCPCKGNSTFSRPGNIGVCYYPRLSCCDPLTHQIIDTAHACGPQPPFPSDPEPPSWNTTACTEFGYWGAWSSWSTCAGTLTCGMCGTATRGRTCISEAWGCPCCDEGNETKPCGIDPCTGDTPCCNGSYLTTIYNGGKVCITTELTCTGEWTGWMEGARNCSCGACGNRTESRYCMPSGCKCVGEFTRNLPCSLELCAAPKAPCCGSFGPYTFQDTDTTVCGPCDGNYSWTEWVNAPGAVCTDVCGSCGLQSQVRKCRYGCCPQNEPKTRQVPCGHAVCLYPRTSCCAPYTKMIINATFVCGLANWTVPATTPAPEPCNVWGGTWSAWQLAPDQTGYDYCGGCWKMKYVRTCLDAATCACQGDSIAFADGSLAVCYYPRLSCCPPKRAAVGNGTFICDPYTTLPPDPAPPVQNPNYCSPYGYWASWGSWSACTATCGNCGTRQRNRTCSSAARGCPCKNPASNIEYGVERCGQPICQGATPCCNGYAVVTGYDNYKYCAQTSVAPVCTGTWTEWASSSGATCSDTCGNCGLTPVYRYCYPSGCQCPGPFTTNVPCGNPVCLYPRASCCTPYKKLIVNGGFICG